MRARTQPNPFRWTKELKSLKALSIRQPWAWLVVNGYKDIENRSWRTHYRGPLLVHASMSIAGLKEEVWEEIVREFGVKNLPQEYDIGGVMGVVDIVDCVKKSKSPWHQSGNWGWVLANPRPLPFRECKGAVGFFRPQI
jgi:hypothetical protein